MQRLVANQLATLPLGDHTDPSTEGLQFRVRKKQGGASRTWLFRFTWRGEWVRQTIGHYPGTTLVEARETAQGLRKNISQGIDPRRARPSRRPKDSPQSVPSTGATSAAGNTIEHLFHEFMERHVRPTRKRPEYAEALLQKDVLPEWAGRDVRSITPREVIELLDKIVARGSKVIANRVAALLSQMFRFGIHRALLTSSPVQLLYRPGGKERARERTLSDKELAIFLADPRACTRFERLEYVLMILLLTGQRRGELTLAKWRNVDLAAGTWRIPDEDAKAGKGHTVPLSKLAIEQFRGLKAMAEGSPYVLPDTPGSKQSMDPKLLTRGVARCQVRMKRLGIDGFTLHDLRRTCRTGLARLKIAPHIAERVLNHAQEKIEGTYDTHDYLEEKREALDKWAAHLEGLCDAR
jgi:integrase